jgi:hypothetical protein
MGIKLRRQFMKKIFIFGLLIILLAFCFIGCEDGNSNDDGNGGIFTLTGIPSNYNGNYAIFAAYPEPIGGYQTAFAVGFQSMDINTWIFTAVQISNGSVNLPMWTLNSNDKFVRYSGSDTAYDGTVYVLNQRIVQEEDIWHEYGSDGSGEITYFDMGEAVIAVRIISDITFLNGTASKNWTNGFGFGRTVQNLISQSYAFLYRNIYKRQNSQQY